MRTRGLWQPVTVSLRRLFPSASFVGCGDIRVSEATDQSAVCAVGGLFAAVRGTRHDGLGYVDAALERGAGSLLVPHPVSTVEVPQCVVHDVRAAYAVLCQALAGQPSQRLNVAGITGTDGKTTVAWLLRSIWQAAGHPSGLMGTIEYDDGGHTQQADLTTPGPDTLASWLAAMVARGTTHAAVELSSHALDQDRAAGVGLDVAVLTNLTQDHFDYHGDLANYAAAKSRILDLCDPAGIVVFNADDSRINTMISSTAGDRIGDRTRLSFGIETDADFTARIVDESVSGTRFQLQQRGHTGTPADSIELSTRLIGRHNVMNCLAAAAVAVGQGVPASAITSGIGSLAWVPGRLESVRCGQPFDVFVDFAHTETALRRCLESLRQVVAGRVICVFGAGGDRDRGKRPLLGAAAAAGADVCIVTSDNPRSEDPRRILESISAGVVGGGAEPVMVEDRQDAIAEAIGMARAGDAILVAGKGHETYQEIGGRRLRFDDREVVRATLHGVAWSDRVGA